MNLCVCACVFAYVCAPARTCVRVCVRACVRACVCVCVLVPCAGRAFGPIKRRYVITRAGPGRAWAYILRARAGPGLKTI